MTHQQPNAAPPTVETKAVEIQAADGTWLAGQYFPAATPIKAPVLICGATGVAQRFYAPFATWPVEQGYSALTFDFRGIGQSLRHSHVRLSPARKQDWGQLDMPAALDWLRQRAERQQCDLVGHSAGAQLIGLMPNHGAIRRVVMVAGSSGHVRGIRFPGRLWAEVFLRAYLPLTSGFLGYSPLRVIRFGEDLPAGVAKQWARWCQRPGYVANSFGREIERHYYDEFRAPILSLHASDDRIASPANVQDLLRLFPKTRMECRSLVPADFGYTSIGHVDFFRRTRSRLWPLVTEWFDREWLN